MRLAVSTASILLVLTGARGVARADGPTDAIEIGKGVSILARRVAASTFVQGSSATDEMRETDEETRQVRISRPFYIATTPVTRGAFTVFADETGYKTEAERGTSGGSGWDGTALVQAPRFNWRTPGFAQGDTHPVVLVTFADAQAFASWLAKRAGGRAVRLPTEAEYELAARAGTTTRWSSGDRKEDALAQGWFKQNAGSGTQPVGMRISNGFGLFDTAGNVYEWCRDAYGPYAVPQAQPVVDPVATQGPSGEPLRRVLRGGSWLRDPKNGRSAARYRSTEGTRSAEIGFRVVWDADLAGGAASVAGSGTSAATATSDVSPEGGAPTSFFVIAGAVVAGLAGVLFAMVRGARRSSPPSASGPTRQPARGGGDVVAPFGVMVEIVDDGFWIRSRTIPVGTSLRYHVVAGGESSSGVAVLVAAASGTYVYTGARPSRVRVDDPNASATPSALFDSPDTSRTYGTAAGLAQPHATPISSDDGRAFGSAPRSDDTSPSTPFIGYPPAY